VQQYGMRFFSKARLIGVVIGIVIFGALVLLEVI
jgi:hypothetical protein